jgi:hypothetical protein
MDKSLAVIAIHGMGDTPRDYAAGLKSKLEKRLGAEQFSFVHFESVYYQDILQKNQAAMFKAMRRREIDFIKLRKFLLYGFSDAAGLERNASEPGSPYRQAQQKILDTLERCAETLGSYRKPVIFVAHSLGCHVLSNYIWDAQATHARQGLWQGSTKLRTADDKFRRLKTLRALFTTGCNIPIFLAGFPRDNIKPVKTSTGGYNFKWHNYYDQDDVLGWPLRPLSPAYLKAIYRDEQINADGGFLGKFTRGWNPLSHNGYWRDKDFLKPLAAEIGKHIDQ